jgi:hypothetical protein
MAEVARKYPDINESWSAVSALASYRTASIEIPHGPTPDQLPDCNSASAKLELIYPDTLGFKNGRDTDIAYVFRDCRLHLDHLPGHGMRLKLAPNTPGNTGDRIPPGVYGLGHQAYAINTVLVWNGTLSDTDILDINTINCRFEFNTEHTPPAKGQELLLAALGSATPGSSVLKLN